MFDIFERINKVVPPIPVVKPPEPESKCHYTVGTTTDGMTVLKVGDGRTTITLTMCEVGIRQLIRMLEATLQENKK